MPEVPVKLGGSNSLWRGISPQFSSKSELLYSEPESVPFRARDTVVGEHSHRTARERTAHAALLLCMRDDRRIQEPSYRAQTHGTRPARVLHGKAKCSQARRYRRSLLLKTTGPRRRRFCSSVGTRCLTAARSPAATATSAVGWDDAWAARFQSRRRVRGAAFPSTKPSFFS